MTSSTENVKLGVCNVLFDGTDLGYTKGGVEVEVATTTHEVTVDQFGLTPISELVTGRTVSVKVPLAETTLDNLVAIMPGSVLISDGVKATGTVTFVTAAPAAEDKITIGGVAFTYKAAPVGPFQLGIAASIGAAAAAFAAAVNAAPVPVTAVAVVGVVTLTAKTRGVAGNVPLVKTIAVAANVTVSGATLAGGVDSTKARVEVSSGVNINLLSLAKTLVLRPIGTSGADDFTVYRAACPGALQFAYQTENERIYTANFKGYVDAAGKLFQIGDSAAV